MERLKVHRGLSIGHLVQQKAFGEGLHVGLRCRSKACVATSVVGRAYRSATGLGDRSEAGFFLGHNDANGAASFAGLANAFGGGFGASAAGHGQNDLDELVFIDWAAAELEIDLDVLCDGARVGQRLDHFRRSVDSFFELLMVCEISQSLHTSGRSARSDGDEFFALRAEFYNTMKVFRGADGTFDDRKVIGARSQVAGGFSKVSKLDTIGQCQELFFAVQEGQLAAIAGGEFHDRNGRFTRVFHRFFHALEILDLKESLGQVVGDDRAIFA